MRSRASPGATRILLTFAIVMAAGVAGAATPVGQDGSANSQTVRHPAKADVHRMRPVKVRVGKVPIIRPPGGDQKVHVVPPVAVVPPVPSPPKPPVKESTEPPPKIPRFAALKTDDTNMRKGPGQRYPIEWVYQRRDLPVEVEREYDVWRYVRDSEGVEGWVHQVTLSDRRTFLVTDKDATLRADTKETATPVALLRVGVIGRLRQCEEGSKWCEVQVGGYRGYLRRDQVWGLLPDEVVAPS
jgi:SH3-like domain-containing protein